MSAKLLILILISDILIVATVIFLIRRSKLSEEYALVWLIVALVSIIGISLSKYILMLYINYKGIHGAGPEILIYLVVYALIFFLMYLSVKLSILKKNVVSLTKAVALLEAKLQEK